MPGSPSASMKTNPSMTNPLEYVTPSGSVTSHHASYAPPQQPVPGVARDGPLSATQAARMNPSFSTGDIAALAAGGQGGGRDSSAASGKPIRSSSMVFDGMEPRMFPGVVDKSTRRRSSIARSGSFSLNDGAIGAPTASIDAVGQRNDLVGDVIEESERERSRNGTPRETDSER
jgi:hypothetical protein